MVCAKSFMSSVFLHVFIPAFGHSPYLRSAIKSAIESVDESTPITVIDDASPSSEVFSIAAEFQPRIEYRRNDVNLGISANFLNSFNLSSGLFTLVMGSDDEMLPGYELELSKSFNRFPDTTVFQPRVLVMNAAGQTCTPLVDRVKRIIQGSVDHDQLMNPLTLAKKLFIGDFMYFPATAWRTETLKSANWNLTYQNAVDLDLLFQLSLGGKQFVFQNAQTFKYRRHSASISSVLALESTRLNEELAAHLMAKNLIPEKSGILIRLLAHLAPTVRIHAMIIGIKQLPRNPTKGVKHFLRALGPLRPIKTS
jgi:glycosyltransferase involved in cell wall biosynthesis